MTSFSCVQPRARLLGAALLGLASLAISGAPSASAGPYGSTACAAIGNLSPVPSGGECDVDAHGVCKRIHDNAPNNIMVPYNTAGEWSTVNSSTLSGIATVSQCYFWTWSGWSGWSGCSASNCGECGTQTRTRNCLRQETSGGTVTVGDSECGIGGLYGPGGGSSSDSQGCCQPACPPPPPPPPSGGGCSISFSTNGSANSSGCGVNMSLSYNNCTVTNSTHYWTGSCPYTASGSATSFPGEGWAGGWGNLSFTNGCDDGNRRGCVENYCVFTADGQTSCVSVNFNY